MPCGYMFLKEVCYFFPFLRKGKKYPVNPVNPVKYIGFYYLFSCAYGMLFLNENKDSL
jgi:hypothetical protein